MLNVVTLMGRMVKKPEIREISNTKICRFTLAVQRNRKNQNNEYETDFIDCVSFNKTAQFTFDYFDKGSMTIVVGRFQSRQWQDKNGNNRTTIEVVADEVQFGESKRQSSSQNTQTYPQAQNSYTAPPFVPTNDSDFAELDNDSDTPF